MKNSPLVNRRQALKSSAVIATTLALNPAWKLFVQAAASDADILVPFLDMPRSGPNRLDWETLDTWLTPDDQAFNVQHYGVPEVDPTSYRLEITGLVDRPLSLSIQDLKALPKKDQFMTLECSGNGSSKGFMNAVYNSRWTGTPLLPLLESAGIQSQATEIVFFGADTKEEVLRPGTKRELTIEVPFGRGMSLSEVHQEPLLLAYERNGQALEIRHGAPLRLIAPGYYGVANVKWITRIDVRDRRYMGRYMARDYVTVRGERQGDEIVYVESSVARMNLKSIIARVSRGDTRNDRIPLKAFGAAWSDGTKIKSVEVKIDNGPWKCATLDTTQKEKYCWQFFNIDLGDLPPGKHTLVSRAIDVKGRIQPSENDDEIALKKTYWEANQQWPRDIEIM